ncbi:hypothetical protein [Nostoc sp. TCL240-02]|uniref:hypothetical protein n=1 Tax=Nostoc sp. TCL240-02 TaxID=2572090 RepID=UPI00157F9D44|nr:hypothetical protein [Nostoc sp. TCL240-02]
MATTGYSASLKMVLYSGAAIAHQEITYNLFRIRFGKTAHVKLQSTTLFAIFRRATRLK